MSASDGGTFVSWGDAPPEPNASPTHARDTDPWATEAPRQPESAGGGYGIDAVLPYLSGPERVLCGWVLVRFAANDKPGFAERMQRCGPAVAARIRVANVLVFYGSITGLMSLLVLVTPALGAIMFLATLFIAGWGMRSVFAIRKIKRSQRASQLHGPSA